jgi:hypothetical protein
MLARMRSLVVVVGLALVVVASPRLNAQIHGVPASVTSFGFGGSHSFAPGVPASVTSLGPNGFGGGHGRFGSCCFDPFFQTGSQSPMFARGHHPHHDFFGSTLPVFGYGVPYTQVVVVQPDAGYGDDEDEYYDGGPTIFERRGSRAKRTRVVEIEREPDPAPAVQPAVAAEPPVPIVPQPNTVIVFRDGHQTELQNYAIIGDTLFDFTDNLSHKIQLADVDLTATHKANDARGVDFQVPARKGK